MKMKTTKYIVLQLIKLYFVVQQDTDTTLTDGKEGYLKFI